jgi:type VI secretion system protein ImpF
MSPDRLQPALLDRLLDEEPGHPASHEWTMSRQAYRDAVVRDIGSLLNAVAPIRSAGSEAARSSVLGYGLPPLAGRSLSTLDLDGLARAIRRCLQAYEPRLAPDSIVVLSPAGGAEASRHNVVPFEIRAHLWWQPAPIELAIRTDLDLETGVVRLQPVSGFR